MLLLCSSVPGGETREVWRLTHESRLMGEECGKVMSGGEGERVCGEREREGGRGWREGGRWRLFLKVSSASILIWNSTSWEGTIILKGEEGGKARPSRQEPENRKPFHSIPSKIFQTWRSTIVWGLSSNDLEVELTEQ